MKSSRQAVILVGGAGTRLAGAIPDIPKPLAEVCGRPFVEHILINLRRFGFDNFLLLAGFQSETLIDRYHNDTQLARELDASIKVIAEPRPLGTGGALRHAAPYLEESFLLHNGDTYFDFNFLDLCLEPEGDTTRDWLVRMALTERDDATRFGAVDLDGHQVIRFSAKAKNSRPAIINAGVYWLRRKLLATMDDSITSLEHDILPALAHKRLIQGKLYRGYFIDIGIPRCLEQARRQLHAVRRRPAAFLDRDGTLNHDEGYTHRIETFQWLPGAKAAIKRLNDSGYLVFIVTNQSGVARGLYDVSDVQRLHDWMQADLRTVGAHVDEFHYCPHHPLGSVSDYCIDCECRKPKTGLLQDLIARWPVDLQASFLLGDSDRDVASGTALKIMSKKIAPGSILVEVEKFISEHAVQRSDRQDEP